jgi:hypothetical protein
MNFSERIGISKRPVGLQLRGMSDELRVALWNIVCAVADTRRRKDEASEWPELAMLAATRVENTPADDVPLNRSRAQEEVKRLFLKGRWEHVYDFVEVFVERTCPTKSYGGGPYANFEREQVERRDALCNVFNQKLEWYMSGYRFIGGRLAPISSEVEAAEIEAALAVDQGPFVGARDHIQKAMTQLSKRPVPDYANAAKESVLALEAACKAITKDDAATLGEALKEVRKLSGLPPTLEQALQKLHGYASSVAGIRHTKASGPEAATVTVGFADAKLAVVLCSGVMNYLIQLHGESRAGKQEVGE